MTTLSAMILGIGVAVTALVRSGRFVRQDRPEVLRRIDARNELLQPGSLRLAIGDDGFTIDVIDPDDRDEASTHVVQGSIPHFAADACGSRPIPAEQKHNIHQVWPNIRLSEHLPVFELPLRYSASGNAGDAAGFAALLTRLRALPERVCISDLGKNAEAAYLETRPSGFDFNAYYRSNR